MSLVVGIGACLDATRPNCLRVFDLCSRKGAWPRLPAELAAWA